MCLHHDLLYATHSFGNMAINRLNGSVVILRTKQAWFQFLALGFFEK